MEEGKTRSGKTISGGGTKRKRVYSTEEEEASHCKKKMGDPDPQMETLKNFFSKELDDKLKLNRDEIAKDNRESINALTRRIDATQSDLNSHKQGMDEELRRVNENINSLRSSHSQYPPTTYADAAGCPATVFQGASINPELDRDYWRSRKSARVASIPGSCLLYTSDAADE